MNFRSKCQRGLIWLLFSAIIASLFNPLFAKKASAVGLTPVTSCVGLGTLQNGSFELDNYGNPGVPGSGTGFDGAYWLAYNYLIGDTSLNVPLRQILDVNGNQSESPGILGWNTTVGDGLVEIQREFVGSLIEGVTASSDGSTTTFTTNSPVDTPLTGQAIYITGGFGGTGYELNRQYLVSSSTWDSESGYPPVFTIAGLDLNTVESGSIKIIYSPSIDVSNRTGYSFFDFSTLKPFSGTYMAEINAESQGTLFQNIPTIPGTTIRWSLRHAARAANGPETMSVLIGSGAYPDSGERIPASELSNTESPYGFPSSIWGEGNLTNPYQGTLGNPLVTRISTDTEGVQTAITIDSGGALVDELAPEFNRAMGDSTAWTLYRGAYDVPDGNQNKFTYFGFQSQDYGTIGNLLDDIQFTPVAGCPLAVVAPANLTTAINPFTCIDDATCTGESPALAPIPEAGASRSVSIQSVTGFGNSSNVSVVGENISYSPPAGDGTTTVTYVVSYSADGITSESASTIAFTTAPPTYSISFASGSGPTSFTLPSTITGISSGTSQNISTTASAAGYTFAGWSSTSGGLTVDHASPAIFNMPSSNVTLTAQWTHDNSPTFTANFYSNGGTFTDNTTVQSASNVPSGTDALSLVIGLIPLRSNYSFKGWSIASLDPEIITSPYPLSANKDFFAQWDVGYNATYDANGGKYSDNSTIQTSSYYASGTDALGLMKPTDPTRVGHTFLGWTTSSDTTTLLTSYPMNSNVTLLAKWAINTYNITVTQGSHGAISPGTSSVNHGSNRSFSITPSSGYQISTVLIDGVNNSGAVSSGSFTFNSVIANHTIAATFLVIYSPPPPAPDPDPTPSPTPTPTPSPSASASASPTPTPTPSPSPTKTTIIIPTDPTKPVVVATPKADKKSSTKKAEPARKITVTKNENKTVIKIEPKPVMPKPTISVGNSDIAVNGLNKGQRIRVTLVGKDGLTKVVTPKSDAELASVVNKNPNSSLTIEITPTLDSALKKGAQIAIKGAKKNQRVKVTIK